jgi:hypothetical protein
MKIVRGGHAPLNSASTRPLRSGSSGTASLNRSASAAAVDRSDVSLIRACAEARSSEVIAPPLSSLGVRVDACVRCFERRRVDVIDHDVVAVPGALKPDLLAHRPRADDRDTPHVLDLHRAQYLTRRQRTSG